MTSVLKEIYRYKKSLVSKRKLIKPEKVLIKEIQNMKKTRGFKEKIDNAYKKKQLSIIAEIKKASPSKGIICKHFNPCTIAKNYTDGGATCISILTDEKYFGGKDKDLIDIRAKTSIPILRKDFIVSEYQVYESRAIGSDCILLISNILSKKEIRKFTAIAHEIKLDVIIETHTKKELIDALTLDNVLIGINNRNLNNMKVNINNSIELVDALPKNFNFICESGINSLEDIKNLLQHGFKTFLIGEFLMKKSDPKITLKKIFDII